MLVTMAVIIVMLVSVLLPKNLAGQFLLAMNQHVNLGGRDAASVYPGKIKASPNVQGGDCFFKDSGGHTGVKQRAKKHVAADSGETVEISDSHGGRWYQVVGKRSRCHRTTASFHHREGGE